MDNDEFQAYLIENKFEELFNPFDSVICQYYDENEFISANRNGDGFLNIFSMNIRSLPKHGGELVNFISNMETKFDVIILTEIGARNLSVVLNLFPAYTFHYVRPQNNNYGGVGIYTHNSLLNVVMMEDMVLTKSCDCSKCEFESLFIEFMYNGILYTVGGIYRHPSGNVSHFVSSLETILTKLDDRKNVILAGDMNIDLIKYTNENVMSYMSTMMSYRYLPYVTLPTRITQFSTTCIDHIFVKKSHKEKVLSTLCGMFCCDISDHLPCFISLQYANNSYAGNRPMTRIFGARNCSKFVQKMTTENWNDKYMDSEHDWYHKFVTTVHQIFQQSFPLVQLSRRQIKDKPWITKGLKISIMHKNRLYKTQLLRPGRQQLMKYNKYKDLLRRCLKEAETNYYQDVFDSNKNSVYNIWKTLNPIINPKAGSKSTSINKLLVDGKVIKDKSNIYDAMNNHFCTIGEVLKSDLPDWGYRYKEYLPARVMNSFFIEPICNDDVGLEIRHLNPKKAPGPDCIGGKLIQLCPDIFSDNLTKIYNRAIQTGVYPHDMKLAQVIALYKKGAKHDPNNYRPISLLSIFDKIFEKILCKRLISFLERNRILYCHQYGFRKFYSTLLALIEVTDLIKRFLDEKQYVIGIFIDFRKAFDTVNHDILLDKLECYGIRGHANKFFRSYLTNRRQYTLVNGIKSNSGYVNCGVPQGSVLGPLLFLLYINDIKHAIGCDNVKLFADDTFLFTNDRNIDAVKEKASNLFEKIFPWCVANQLSINSEKTNFVLFHAKNKPIPENFDCIHTTFITLNRVKCVQYLGLMIDENLYWHMHVEHVYNSLVKYFGIFNHVKTIISKKIARQLYFAFIHSRIKYGIEVFGDCANEYLQKLQVIQNKLLKLLLNFDRRTSTN